MSWFSQFIWLNVFFYLFFHYLFDLCASPYWMFFFSKIFKITYSFAFNHIYNNVHLCWIKNQLHFHIIKWIDTFLPSIVILVITIYDQSLWHIKGLLIISTFFHFRQHTLVIELPLSCFCVLFLSIQFSVFSQVGCRFFKNFYYVFHSTLFGVFFFFLGGGHSAPNYLSNMDLMPYLL